jgi:cation diffusion facilitator CzcD-associated flavoprotein CzcO
MAIHEPRPHRWKLDPTTLYDAEVPAPKTPVIENGVPKNTSDAPTINGFEYDPFKLDTRYAYSLRKVRVITIGAGFSGLLMAHKFHHRFPEMRDIVQHTIFEARSDVGGTWRKSWSIPRHDIGTDSMEVANHYPGVQCDVPAHIYAFPFDPNPDWTRFYASGADILAYMKATVRKWNLDKDLHLETRVIGAHWQPDEARWKITVENKGARRDEYCEVLISAQGVLV